LDLSLSRLAACKRFR